MKSTFISGWLSIVFSLLAAHPCLAQQTATLSGVTQDPNGAPLPGTMVVLENAVTRYTAARTTGTNGEFTFNDVPLQDYQIVASRDGFALENQPVSLRSTVPVRIEVRLRLLGQGEQIDVRASTDLLDVEATGTRTALSLNSTSHLPIPVGTRGLETVLLSFPGFAQNANGAIHPRGAHNQMTFVIDGMPISDQLTGAFASALDPSMAESLELFTGNIPAEFGSKVSGVASVITKSGLGSGRRVFGQTELNAAQFDTVSNSTQMGGQAGRLGWFTSVSVLKTNRFLDQVSLENLHNGGNAERSFARLDYQATPRDAIHVHAMAGRSSFQLTNLRSQAAAGQRQRQLLRDSAFWVNWTRSLDAASALEVTAAYRTSIAQLFSSPGDTPVTADQARHLSTLTFNTRYSRLWQGHRLRAGADWQRIPLSEDFSFGITSPAFNEPKSPDFRPTLVPYDLSRGGARFYFSSKATGNVYSGFAQDDIKWKRFTLGLGWRYDAYQFLVKGFQLQPRLGIAFHLKETGTVFRASYNRNYQTPPNENLLLSDSAQAAALAPEAVREALGGARIPIRPERQDVFEMGLQQTIFGKLGFNASYYHKRSADQQDNDNFLNTGIIFPVTLSRIRVNGVEGRLVLPPVRGLQGSLSITHAHAISTPPFTGGVFLNTGAVAALTAGPFVIDHDQVLSIQGTLVYQLTSRIFLSSGVRHDSGLVANPSDPAKVAADPDYADLLPYVDLRATTPRTRPRTIFDFGAGYTHTRRDRPLWDIQFQINNLTNQTALFNFQSIFVGTRLVPPRVLGLKLRFYW
jgi:outer membrane cobalamin receptor